MGSAPDLSVTIGGVRLASPLVLASGIWGTTPDLLERAARGGAGAPVLGGVTAKTCTIEPRRGHRNPSAVDWGHGVLNAMGLPNPGAKEEAALLAETRRRLAPLGVAVIASVAADTAEGFGEAAAIVAEASPDLVELNISCPNVAAEHGEMFASSASAAAAATRAARRRVKVPLLVKLSPNVSDIAEIARAVVDAGADGIVAINTMPGMLIDAESGRPVLANRTGGISGAALKPIALRCVDEIARAVAVPIVGTGGITTGLDAIEMVMAGATAVGIGTVVASRGEAAFRGLAAEMQAWLEERGLADLAAIRGCAGRGGASGAGGWRAAARGAGPRETNLPPVPGWRPDARRG